MTDAAAPLALLAGASRGLGLALAHELGDGVTRWVSDVEEEVGAIEVMICVAGIIQVGPLDDLDRSLFGFQSAR